MATHSSIPTWGCKESDMTERARARTRARTHTHTLIFFTWLRQILVAACRILDLCCGLLDL